MRHKSNAARAAAPTTLLLGALLLAGCGPSTDEPEASASDEMRSCEPYETCTTTTACITCYLDADGDGYGSSTTKKVCSSNIDELECPEGYAYSSGDCNDQDPDAVAKLTCYTDGDGDGYGAPGTSTSVCAASCPSGTVQNDDDCKDSRSKVHTYTCYTDGDGDGIGATETKKEVCGTGCSSGTVIYYGDCYDTDPNKDACFTNPGNVTLSSSGGILRLGAKGGSVPSADLSGTIDKEGDVLIEQEDIKIATYKSSASYKGITYNIEITLDPTSDAVGRIDPGTGSVDDLSFSFNFNVKALKEGVKLYDCTSKTALTVHLTTEASGSQLGTPYDDSTGKLTLVDGTFVPDGYKTGCTVVDSYLGLPESASQSYLKLPFELDPRILSSMPYAF